MEDIFEKYHKKIQNTQSVFTRSILNAIDWNYRFIGIKGARGVGKTTLLLQYIQLNLKDSLAITLYASLDNIWFSNHSLLSLVDYFVKRGGKFLFLDEVHKYPQWSQSLKNIYDDYPELKVVFTGSSLLEILNASADLSRRAVIYEMQGLSFREYISLETGADLPIFSLQDILSNHTSIALEMNKAILPLAHFEVYLKQGYYPFYKENTHLYLTRLEQVIDMMLEFELPFLRKVDLGFVYKLKQLLVIIAESVPFIPNITKLSEKIGLQRTTLLQYLYYLDEVALTKNIFKEAGGMSKLQKPAKLLLENTNLMQVLSKQNTNKGNSRETFFVNQLSHQHQITYADYGDFLVDDSFVIEVGGKTKTNRQIQSLPNAFIAADDIDIGHANKIPLWLFGFLY